MKKFRSNTSTKSAQRWIAVAQEQKLAASRRQGLACKQICRQDIKQPASSALQLNVRILLSKQTKTEQDLDRHMLAQAAST